MGITEDLADALAQDTIKAMAELGDDKLIAQVAEIIGASSQTTQEAFLTAVRVRLSERRAREFLAQKRAAGPTDPSKVGQLGTGRVMNPTDDEGGH
ncbi:hypothetical protein [Flavimaricola marinus]|uniref:Uncharacterized protein n=1 Tax=Flavimaricola marinus TaxID=1819565 RepID=A0A238LDE3_9RHOB|nr:hypothetical protein [Flavimaricola marinus]SMY07602.1 hypothetical protein LOM8899_01739 [Flavimaricola marinus]